MQLSVFITPVLMKHPELGFGVCEELVVVVDQIATHQQQASQSALDHASHSITSHYDTNTSHEKPIHSAVANCKFCLILGYQFDPILIACIILLLASLTTLGSRPQVEYRFRFHQKLRLFLFQNRAPPLLSVFTPLAVI